MKKISFRSFRIKLFVCILTTSFLLLFAGLISLTRYSIKKTVSLDNQMMLKNLSFTTENLEKLLDESDRVATLTFSQENILANLKKEYQYRSSEYLSIQHALIAANVSGISVRNINLCDGYGFSINSSSVSLSGIPFTNLDECNEYLSNIPEKSVNPYQSWYFPVRDPVDTSKYCFLNTRNINLFRYDRTDPLLLVYISEDKISSTYEYLGEHSMIVTPSGYIISAVDKNSIGSQVEETVIKNITASNKETIAVQNKGGYRYISYLPTIDSYLVINDTSETLSLTKLHTAIVAAIIIVLGFVFSAIWSRLISYTISKPLVETKACIERVRSGNINVRCNTSYDDEIGYLAESFNQMMDSLDDIIKQREEQKIIAKEAEFRLLQSQINPHLLYNSLDSAMYLMTLNDTEHSVEILKNLSSFFKLSLQRGNKTVTVGSSIELVEKYLMLQKLCRMKNFQLTVVGDEGILNAHIMHMILQPIVENSVIHGFSGSFSDGNIQIELLHENSDLIIQIMDDGSGMTDQELTVLRNAISSDVPGETGFGLWNVAERIRLFYGENYGLSIDSELGEYTRVSVRIPFEIERVDTDV